MRKLGLRSLSGVLMLGFVLIGPAAATHPSGPVGYWPLDGSADDAAHDNDGTVNGGAFFDTVDKAPIPGNGASLVLDGVDDFVGVPDTNGVDAAHPNLDGFTGLTLAGWVNRDTLQYGAIVTKDDAFIGRGSYFLDIEGDELRVAVGSGPGAFLVGKTNAANLATGTWTHVAGTWDGTQTLRLYINCTETTDTTVFGPGVGPRLDDNSVDVEIGAFHSGQSPPVRYGFFDGRLDDVRVYDRALSSSEIIALCPLGVGIDIKPGSVPNCINRRNNGVIPVAILSTADFDASTVDPLTVTLQGSGVRVNGKSGNAGSLEDVDGDGDLDLVVHILDPSVLTGLDMAVLQARTVDGRTVFGSDFICIVPPD